MCFGIASAVFSKIFAFLNVVTGDLALKRFKLLTQTFDFSCFGALRVGPGGGRSQDLATCEGLVHGQ